MSRIGKKPVVIPQGVKVQVENGLVRAEGPKGKLSQSLPDGLIARLENNTLFLTREAHHRQDRALHGTARALVANIGSWINEGYQCKLETLGVGYQPHIQGNATFQRAPSYT